MRGRLPKSDGERARRNPTVAMTQLPAEGRKGRSPEWPLPPDTVTRAKLEVAQDKVEDLEFKRAEGKPVEAALERAREKAKLLEIVLRTQDADERALWKRLWRLPQAVAWERLHVEREVAYYVRWSVLGEAGDLRAAAEARQRSDRLGLTPQSMLRLRWAVASDEIGEKRAEMSSAPPLSAVPGVEAVDPDAVAGT